MTNANGGYYTDGKTILPLRNGAASFVIYRNGTTGVVAWGHGANALRTQAGPDVRTYVSPLGARQNRRSTASPSSGLMVDPAITVGAQSQ
jgi:hypothetical protein